MFHGTERDNGRDTFNDVFIISWHFPYQFVTFIKIIKQSNNVCIRHASVCVSVCIIRRLMMNNDCIYGIVIPIIIIFKDKLIINERNETKTR